MQPDWERDWSYHEYLKATRGARPAAREVAYEDYVRDRVNEIYRLVEDQPAECNGRAFEVALRAFGEHVTVIITRKTVEATTSTGYAHSFDVCDALVFDDGGVLLDAKDAHPVSTRLAIEQTVIHEALSACSSARSRRNCST